MDIIQTLKPRRGGGGAVNSSIKIEFQKIKKNGVAIPNFRERSRILGSLNITF